MNKVIFEHSIDKNENIDQYLSEAITSYGLAQLADGTPLKYFCCCRNNSGKVLGAAMGTKTRDLFFLSHIYVEEPHRNQNIGSQLLAEIEAKAKEAGCRILRLNTLNSLSHRFYEKNGFIETIRIDEYMKGFDLVFYEKIIY